MPPYPVLKKEGEGQGIFRYSGKVCVCSLQKGLISHFNCIIYVKYLATFFRTMFLGCAFSILSLELVGQTRKEDTSSFACSAEGYIANNCL
jgi:hypothetical protein